MDLLGSAVSRKERTKNELRQQDQLAVIEDPHKVGAAESRPDAELDREEE